MVQWYDAVLVDCTPAFMKTQVQVGATSSPGAVGNKMSICTGSCANHEVCTCQTHFSKSMGVAVSQTLTVYSKQMFLILVGVSHTHLWVCEYVYGSKTKLIGKSNLRKYIQWVNTLLYNLGTSVKSMEVH